uniref:Uncharacterized protein n=1 Tax=Pyramimonas obovata TaxID=1411642 RepID=A0A6T7VF33_9CHLO|mmetsp:Transcript_18096/g.39586  ORF Transcript_18096/g.39586 Transcript_18096/m.39586 type:complete len:131 (+) Transcript_18096:541-933(+)
MVDDGEGAGAAPQPTEPTADKQTLLRRLQAESAMLDQVHNRIQGELNTLMIERQELERQLEDTWQPEEDGEDEDEWVLEHDDLAALVGEDLSHPPDAPQEPIATTADHTASATGRHAEQSHGGSSGRQRR